MLGVDIEFRLQFYTCLACLLIICTCILQVSKCLYWFIMVYKEVAIWGGGYSDNFIHTLVQGNGLLWYPEHHTLLGHVFLTWTKPAGSHRW